jgi:cytochrome c oxidase subunit II
VNQTHPPIEIDSFWLPRQGSTIAPSVDAAWDAVYWVSILLFILVMGAATYFALKYKRRGENDRTSEIDHSFKIEVVWSVLPLIIVIGLFAIGAKGYIGSSVPPDEALEIRVTGEKWLWTFTYPNGNVTVNEFAIPKGRPIKLIMSAKDVLHSFYVPEFRVKQDVVPGQYTTMWFEAVKVAESTIQCTEYCGTGHSEMLGKVMVMEEKDYQDWLELGPPELRNMPPAELGKRLFTQRSCNTCHSLDGTKIQGPTFKGLFGRTEDLEGGGTVKVDENYIREKNYIRESVLNPQGKIVKGYPGTMPTFQGLLKDREIEALIEFMKAQK